MTTYLTIVKSTLDREIVHVLIENRGHLQLLDRADTALGEHDEHGDILFASQAVNSSGSGVTRGSTNDCKMMSVCKYLSAPFTHATSELSQQNCCRIPQACRHMYLVQFCPRFS